MGKKKETLLMGKTEVVLIEDNDNKLKRTLNNFKNKIDRKNGLMPNGIPRYIRCYDNGGETFDRYTVVFTGRYTHKTGGSYLDLGMSHDPYHPQGVGSHGESDYLIDRPTYSHLGRKIKFMDLPEQCKKLVLSDYMDLWDIKE